jgi:hypothetical protein
MKDDEIRSSKLAPPPTAAHEFRHQLLNFGPCTSFVW